MQEPVSALVNRHDIGIKCIFRDVKSAEMSLWLCLKLIDSMLMPKASYRLKLLVYSHRGCI